jgi:hypothetical protein
VEDAGDQIAADHEEQIDPEEPARQPRDTGVIEDHRQHRDRAESIDFGPVG